MVALIIFWLMVALIAYTYVGFPLLLLLRGWLWRRPYATSDATPKISMIIAAYNEEDVIGEKLDNILGLDYPSDLLEVIVASDGSDDRTNEIVASYAGKGVKLLALPRAGKASALNQAVAIATGDLLVFSDANSMYDRNALRALVRPFGDPQVGGVAGNQVYLKKNQHASSAGEHGYWNLDRLLKQAEDRAGNTISATGAIYAIRRSLFQPVPEGVTDDFVTSTRVIAQGYRLVFAADAIAYEPVAASSGREFGRKVRIMTRGLRAVIVMRELLNPLRYGFYAVQLFSHKVLRRLLVFAFIALFISNLFLLSHGVFYQITMVAQVMFYACALVGLFLGHTRLGRLKLFSYPFFIAMVYLAALMATINLLRGRTITSWQPQRQETYPASHQPTA